MQSHAHTVLRLAAAHIRGQAEELRRSHTFPPDHRWEEGEPIDLTSDEPTVRELYEREVWLAGQVERLSQALLPGIRYCTRDVEPVPRQEVLVWITEDDEEHIELAERTRWGWILVGGDPIESPVCWTPLPTGSEE